MFGEAALFCNLVVKDSSNGLLSLFDQKPRAFCHTVVIGHIQRLGSAMNTAFEVEKFVKAGSEENGQKLAEFRRSDAGAKVAVLAGVIIVDV